MTEGVLNGFVILSFSILVLALLLKKLKQPYFIGYIIAGVLLGPEILGAINDTATIMQLGELGVILLMFFIGSEINLPHLSKNLRKPLLVAFSQLLLSFGFMCLIGYYLDWSWTIIILLSFVISLSSSAIIFQHLSNTGEIHSKLGLLTSGVLIMQDVLFVPMMLAINFMAEGGLNLMETIKILIGGLLVLLFFRVAVARKMVKIPFSKHLKKDHDLQVFFGFILCFGVAGITHWFGLSAALGAFMAGIFIGQDKALKWLEHTLIPFRVFFLALFFLSIGLQIKLDFLLQNFGAVIFITFSVLIINSFINGLIYKYMGNNLRDSVYAGALLSQIGEFSFVLVSLASSLNLIGDYSYQITLTVISMTMILTTIWLFIIKNFIYKLPEKFSVSVKR